MPKSIDDLEVVGSVMSDLTNTVRLVEVKGSSPPIRLTLRSVSKQAIVDAGMQKHVSGERDIHVSLYEKNALVPKLFGMNVNDSDIHMLYDTQIVGTLETFLDGEPHGESFVRYYAAQVVLVLEFMHVVRFVLLCLCSSVRCLTIVHGMVWSCRRALFHGWSILRISWLIEVETYA